MQPLTLQGSSDPEEGDPLGPAARGPHEWMGLRRAAALAACAGSGPRQVWVQVQARGPALQAGSLVLGPGTTAAQPVYLEVSPSCIYVVVFMGSWTPPLHPWVLVDCLRPALPQEALTQDCGALRGLRAVGSGTL